MFLRLATGLVLNGGIILGQYQVKIIFSTLKFVYDIGSRFHQSLFRCSKTFEQDIVSKALSSETIPNSTFLPKLARVSIRSFCCNF